MTKAMSILEALPGVLGNRGIRSFISGEQGNKSLKLKKTGKQRQFGGTENIENQDFDFGNKGKCRFFQGNKGTGTPLRGPHFVTLYKRRIYYAAQTESRRYLD